MTRLGKPVLVPCAGFIHLAHRTTSGIQLSIENWPDLIRARMAFGSADVEIEPGLFITAAQARTLGALRCGAPLPNKRGMKALVNAGLVAGPWRKRTDRPTLTDKGHAAAGVLLP